MNEDRQALENLVIDNPDLERLEGLLDEFNIFEVLGAVRVELRHSEFLAFLMNPNQNHGLGDDFAKKFLQKAVVGVDPAGLPVTAIDLDIWSLDDLEVRREWQNIDILLLSEQHKLAVIIENKIGTSEHSNQLQRYHRIVAQHFPDWRILGIYLTPEGEEPSDENYLSLSYKVVCELLETMIETREASLGPDVRTLMSHYTTMLRRYIVSGSEIEDLAQKIYKKHQRALDLIFEFKPDLQAEIAEYLVGLLQQQDHLLITHSSKRFIGFVPKVWDRGQMLKGQGWGNSIRMVMFEFDNAADRLKLILTIGPGPIEIRQRLLDIALSNKPPFKSAYKALNMKWNNILSVPILSPKDYENGDFEDHKAKIDQSWNTFLDKTLPEMIAIYNAEAWLWED